MVRCDMVWGDMLSYFMVLVCYSTVTSPPPPLFLRSMIHQLRLCFQVYRMMNHLRFRIINRPTICTPQFGGFQRHVYLGRGCRCPACFTKNVAFIVNAGLSWRALFASNDLKARGADGVPPPNAPRDGLRASGHQAGELLRGELSFMLTSDPKHCY